MRAPGEWSPSFMAFSPGCVNCGVPLGMERRQVPPTRSHSPSIEREGQVIYSAAFHHESGRLKVTLDLAGLESLSVLTPSETDATSLRGTFGDEPFNCVRVRPAGQCGAGYPAFQGANPVDLNDLLRFALVSRVWAHPALPRVLGWRWRLSRSRWAGLNPDSAGDKQPAVVFI